MSRLSSIPWTGSQRCGMICLYLVSDFRCPADLCHRASIWPPDHGRKTTDSAAPQNKNSSSFAVPPTCQGARDSYVVIHVDYSRDRVSYVSIVDEASTSTFCKFFCIFYSVILETTRYLCRLGHPSATRTRHGS